jgi:hypothetical protein
MNYGKFQGSYAVIKEYHRNINIFILFTWGHMALPYSALIGMQMPLHQVRTKHIDSTLLLCLRFNQFLILGLRMPLVINITNLY